MTSNIKFIIQFMDRLVLCVCITTDGATRHISLIMVDFC